MEVQPLDWGRVPEMCRPEGRDLVVLLDHVSDPHNVGAILRSAEVFGARAVIATQRHAAPETGALAKTASGALERQPYLRVRNLAEEWVALRQMGYILIGLDGEGDQDLGAPRWQACRPARRAGAGGPKVRPARQDPRNLWT